MNIQQATNADHVNRIVNDPSVYPWIKGNHTEPLDLKNVVKKHIVLESEYGCVIFVKIQPGVYEFHASVLPEGRGSWMSDGASEAFHWMFTRTDAYELLTKCPDGNLPSKMGAKRVGCTFNFRTGPIWPVDGMLVPVDIYGILIQQWVTKAPKLEEIGEWFHDTLVEEYIRLGKRIDVVEDDRVHNRFVGAAIEMIRGGLTGKALNMYNRFAVMSGYKSISMISSDPLVIDIYEAKIRIRDNSFEVL